jgi:hypothetical protein
VQRNGVRHNLGRAPGLQARIVGLCHAARFASRSALLGICVGDAAEALDKNRFWRKTVTGLSLCQEGPIGRWPI